MTSRLAIRLAELAVRDIWRSIEKTFGTALKDNMQLRANLAMLVVFIR